MPSERLLYAFAVVLYAVATAHGVLLWRREFRRGEWVNFGLLVLGFGLQTGALIGRGFSLARCPVTNLFEAVMFVSWAIVGAYLVVGWQARIRFVGVVLAPVLLGVGVFALQPALDHPGPDFDLEHAAVSLHVSLVLLAYAAFGLGSLAGALYLVRDRRPETPLLATLADRLPEPARLERVLLRSVGTGLILLTSGLILSLGLMRERYGVLVRPDPKIAWSFLVWSVYFGLMLARLKFARAPRDLAWGALMGFGFVMLTFWGTNLLSPIHHP